MMCVVDANSPWKHEGHRDIVKLKPTFNCWHPHSSRWNHRRRELFWPTNLALLCTVVCQWDAPSNFVVNRQMRWKPASIANIHSLRRRKIGNFLGGTYLEYSTMAVPKEKKWLFICFHIICSVGTRNYSMLPGTSAFSRRNLHR